MFIFVLTITHTTLNTPPTLQCKFNENQKKINQDLSLTQCQWDNNCLVLYSCITNNLVKWGTVLRNGSWRLRFGVSWQEFISTNRATPPYTGCSSNLVNMFDSFKLGFLMFYSCNYEKSFRIGLVQSYFFWSSGKLQVWSSKFPKFRKGTHKISDLWIAFQKHSGSWCLTSPIDCIRTETHEIG